LLRSRIPSRLAVNKQLTVLTFNASPRTSTAPITLEFMHFVAELPLEWRLLFREKAKAARSGMQAPGSSADLMWGGQHESNAAHKASLPARGLVRSIRDYSDVGKCGYV
jgi:hypothetical protein